MKKVTYRYITIYSHPSQPDVVFGSYAPHLHIDLAVARELIDNRIEFAEGRSVYTLIDFTNVKSVTKEARDYMNSAEGGLRGLRGGAFLSNNVVSTLLVNLYLQISKPAIPARFFTNESDALRWIAKMRAGQDKTENEPANELH
jgi:hypothetical protein